jgi:Sulfotransferase family
MKSNGHGFAFIVGHRKSGSTWLLNLLSLHPDIRGLMETHLFHLGWTEPDPVPRTKRLFSQTPWSEGGSKSLLTHHLKSLAAPVLKRTKPALALKKEERPATLPDLPLLEQMSLRRDLKRVHPPDEYVHRFFHAQHDLLRPRRYLLEKSPRNVHNIGRIREVFPDARLIVIYRDGRDVVTSDKFFIRDYGGKPFDFAEGVKAWCKDMEAHLNHAEQCPVFACSYERLLEDGAPVVRELFEFLDLPQDPRLIDDLLERSSFRFYAGRDPGKEDRKRFYRKGIAGDWKNHFSDEDRRVFKELAGDMLVRLGYEKNLAW